MNFDGARLLRMKKSRERQRVDIEGYQKILSKIAITLEVWRNANYPFLFKKYFLNFSDDRTKYQLFTPNKRLHRM